MITTLGRLNNANYRVDNAQDTEAAYSIVANVQVDNSESEAKRITYITDGEVRRKTDTDSNQPIAWFDKYETDLNVRFTGDLTESEAIMAAIKDFITAVGEMEIV